MSKVRKAVFVGILLCFSVSMGCGRLGLGDSAPEPTPQDPIDLQMLGGYDASTSQEVIHNLRFKSVRSYEELFNLGTAYFWQRDYDVAANYYEYSARKAVTVEQVSGALYAKAAAIAYENPDEVSDEALRTTDLMVKLHPDNVEAAKLRLALYRFKGDDLGTRIAADHLIRLRPELQGEPVVALLAFTPLIIVALNVVVPAGVVIVAIALTPADDRANVVPSMMKGYLDLAGDVSKSPTKTLGQTLLDELADKQ